jgi:hypothetical protein
MGVLQSSVRRCRRSDSRRILFFLDPIAEGARWKHRSTGPTLRAECRGGVWSSEWSIGGLFRFPSEFRVPMNPFRSTPLQRPIC